MRLPTRLALIGVAVLGVTLAAVALLTYEIVRVTGRQGIDQALHDELGVVTADFARLLEGNDTVTGDDLRQAAQQYLALHPGSRRHLSVLRIGGATYSTRTGPRMLLDLLDEGELPDGDLGHLQTVRTDEGPIRVLNVALTAGGDVVGRATIAGPLDEVEADAVSSLVGIGIAGAIGLVLGGTALTISTRRAVRPAVDLARAARGIGAGDLSTRIPEPRRSDEVGMLAQEFNRMLERISADAEQRRRLVSAVSHELRTPLAIARGHVEMFETLDLTGRDDSATTSELAVSDLVAVLRAELDRLARIADDLEAVAHGGSGAQVDLGPVFAPDILEELDQRLAGLGVMGVDFGEAPPVVVEADQQRLAQALLNLVTNALIHTPAGTHVGVIASTDADHLCLAVTDDGQGVDPSIRERIFEPFITTRPGGSTPDGGLGLAVVKTLVEAQHGTVTVVTDPTGTTATIRLPLTK